MPRGRGSRAATTLRGGFPRDVGGGWGGNGYGRGAAPPRRPPRPRRHESNDAIHIILGSVSEAGGAVAPPASSARVIPTAERYLGTPYRYGGTSPVTGFDCSGFVQYVFARNAVRLPRTSRQQAKVGVSMPRRFSSLTAGDLVMFAERGEAISHVAIYAGHNRITHATSSGGTVRYDDLDASRPMVRRAHGRGAARGAGWSRLDARSREAARRRGTRRYRARHRRFCSAALRDRKSVV